MKKISITLSFDDEKMDALEFSLRKENSSVQEKMDEALRQLYEKTVAKPIREYLDSKNASEEKHRRPPRSVPRAKAGPEPVGLVDGIASGEQS